MALTKNN